MSGVKTRKSVTYSQPSPPRRLERAEWRWPSPTPLPVITAEDIGRVLKQILDRLDAIERRLERIEKLLMEKGTTP